MKYQMHPDAILYYETFDHLAIAKVDARLH